MGRDLCGPAGRVAISFRRISLPHCRLELPGISPWRSARRPRHSSRCLASAASQYFSSLASSVELSPDLFEHTGGRYLFNEELRRSERHVEFNVDSLIAAVCDSIKQPTSKLHSITKLGEGGYNRVLEAKFKDDRKILVRIPFRTASPKHYAVASEAATLQFLRSHDLPVSRVLGYCSDTANPVGIEYLLLEKIEGKSLGEQWYYLSPEALVHVMQQIVSIETRWMKLQLPASGSLYFKKDLTRGEASVPISGQEHDSTEIVVGPTADLFSWYKDRSLLDVERGPWSDFLSCLQAGAKREIAFCRKYGKPRFSRERYVRQAQNLQKQLPSKHEELLRDYLKMTPFLALPDNSRFARHTLRHPDLSPNNIIVNDDNDIVGIIDWQHTQILPLCLCAGIPYYFQNWGDDASEDMLEPEPKLPENFEEMEPADQRSAFDQLHRRLTHFHYANGHRQELKDHHDAFRNEATMLRAKLWHHADSPWEGDSTSLEHTIIDVMSKWPLQINEDQDATPTPECPIQYFSARIQACVEQLRQEERLRKDFQDMKDIFNTDNNGFIRDDKYYDLAKKIVKELKEDMLKASETETEIVGNRDHFPFDDYDEDE